MKPISELKISKSQIKRLAINLRVLMDERRTTECNLARLLDLPVMTVRRLVSGETTDPRISTLKLIADHFNVSIDYLIQDEHVPHMAMLQNQTQPHFVPILDWQTLSDLKSIEYLDKNSWKNWHPISTGNNYTLSQNAFALPSKATMQPRFPIGTLFVVDPSEKPNDGDLVIIRVNKDEISLRELIIDPPNKILYPVIHGSEAVPYNTAQHKIIGVIVLTMLFTRKNV